jgi:hypothetical protein
VSDLIRAFGLISSLRPEYIYWLCRYTSDTRHVSICCGITGWVISEISDQDSLWHPWRTRWIGASDMTGSPEQLVLIKGRKSRGGEWSHDDYSVRDGLGKVVGSILRHPKDRLWFWTITAREIEQSV